MVSRNRRRRATVDSGDAALRRVQRYSERVYKAGRRGHAVDRAVRTDALLSENPQGGTGQPAGHAAGLLCTNVALKHLVGRARPWLSVEGLVPLVEEHDPNSFPSGHTCAAFAAASAWCRTLPRRWMKVTAVVLAALMGFSRLYVGVHFPSDVLAGMAVGLLCGWLACLLWRQVPAWRRLEPPCQRD